MIAEIATRMIMYVKAIKTLEAAFYSEGGSPKIVEAIKQGRYEEVMDMLPEPGKEASEKLPELAVDPQMPDKIEVRMPTPTGNFCVGVCLGEEESPQSWIDFESKEGGPVNLAFAEVKRGELADECRHPDDNHDVSLYVWSDPNDESYTHEFNMPIEDLIT